ncbi:unnamed protein product [Periconia digitata]|uniref:Uncharacterized protein n=1 Tax=Periconia digitata TaxID=1303443 RepID=A0A9W4UTE6_9PLEO|nr:unnamed protein product [Periconia digitata]
MGVGFSRASDAGVALLVSLPLHPSSSNDIISLNRQAYMHHHPQPAVPAPGPTPIVSLPLPTVFLPCPFTCPHFSSHRLRNRGRCGCPLTKAVAIVKGALNIIPPSGDDGQNGLSLCLCPLPCLFATGAEHDDGADMTSENSTIGMLICP